MKKLIMLSITALVAAMFLGCGLEEGTTLKWKNRSQDVKDNYDGIRWVNANDSNDAVAWDSVPAVDADSSAKDVDALVGYGEAVVDGGTPAEITLDPADDAVEGVATSSTSSATLKENADATLVISAAKKK